MLTAFHPVLLMETRMPFAIPAKSNREVGLPSEKNTLLTPSYSSVHRVGCWGGSTVLQKSATPRFVMASGLSRKVMLETSQRHNALLWDLFEIIN